MKKILIFAIGFGLSSSFAQQQEWQWVKSEGTNVANDISYSVTTDATGNSYITGYTSAQTLNIGSFTLNGSGVFLAKYSPQGSVIWAKIANGAASGTTNNTVACDQSGHVFISGNYTGLLVFNTLLLYSYTGSNELDFFLAKYDTSGNLFWAKSFGGSLDDNSNSIASDSDGNIYLAGSYESTSIDFGTGVILWSNNPGTYDVFVTKFDKFGNALWTITHGGILTDKATTISIDLSGNIFMAGSFKSTSIFGTTNILNNHFIGTSDIFLAKIDSAGILQWTTSAGSLSDDEATCMSTDLQGNIYLGGYFSGQNISFGSSFLSLNVNTTSTSFIAKFNSGGVSEWAKCGAGNAMNKATSICTDITGNAYLTGTYFNQYLIFESDTLFCTNNFSDIFLVKYNAIGDKIWVRGVKGQWDDYPASICYSPLGSIMLTGYFKGTSLFFESDTLKNSGNGNFDFFIASLDITTGITRSQKRTEFNLYPNPFHTYANLEFDDELKNLSVLLYTSLGQLIRKIDLSNSAKIIDKGLLPSGVYFLQLINERVVLSTKKIIITD